MAQAARDPHVILVTIYIFAPYFVTRVAPDPVTGQAMIAAANKWGGWAVMLTMPFLGALVDRLGPRKPFLVPVIAVMVAISFAQWFVPPRGLGLPGLPIGFVLFMAAAMAWLFAAHETLHNALLVPAAGVRGAARASGLGLAGGNAMSVLLLTFVLIAFALPGNVGWNIVPARPLFGLDPATGETARIVAPLVATVMLLGSLPLFRYVPDMARTALSLPQAVRAALGDLAALVRGARGEANPLIYLLARMIYTDGMTAILIFGGLFAAGTMRWGTLEMLGYGITLSCAAVIGGLLAGRLDGWIGPKRSVMLELSLLILFQGLILGMGRERILYQPYPDAPKLWNGPIFATLPEWVFLGLGCCVAVTITAAYASSRTLLTRVAPPERMGVFFGLYALSGAATMWLGPFLVEIATRIGGTQASGFVPVIGLLAAGLAILPFVKGGGRL